MRCPYRFSVEMVNGDEQDCIMEECYACQRKYIENEGGEAYICMLIGKIIKVDKDKKGFCRCRGT